MAIRIAPLDDNLDFPEPVKQRQISIHGRNGGQRDIRDWLRSGETLDTSGATSTSWLIQRAVNDAATTYTPGRQVQLYFPNGRYRIGTKITWKSGVGIKGESRAGVVFLPEGTQSFIDGRSEAGYSFDECEFADFTVDGAAQVATSYTTHIKGIYIQFMRKARFERVTVKNTWATGFGVDHLDDAWFVDCVADGNGRGIAALGLAPKTSSGHSGFGIGTGGYRLEAVSIINCTALNNGLYGIFTEKQPLDPHFPEGLRVIGCVSSGNYTGFKDCGSTGAIVQGNQFINNQVGVLLDGTVLVPYAGKDGRISGNVITGNQVGVQIGAAGQGGYSITDNEIYGNSGDGISIPASATLGDRFDFEDNRIHNNGGKGINIQASSNLLTISRNKVWGNTGGDLAIEGANRSANGLVLEGNDLRGAVISITQPITGDFSITGNHGATAPASLAATTADTSVRLTWAAPGLTAAPINDYRIEFRGLGAASWTQFEHAPSADTGATVTGLTGGLLYELRVAAVTTAGLSPYAYATASPGIVELSDTFNRADTTSGLGSTDGGTNSPQAWSASSYRVLGGRALCTSTSTAVSALVTASSSEHAVETVVTNVPPSQSQAVALIVREASTTQRVWLARSSSTGRWNLQSFNNGAFVSIVETGIVAASGDRLRVHASGDTYTVYVNGVFVGSGSSSVANAGTQVGYRAVSPASFDDFKVIRG